MKKLTKKQWEEMGLLEGFTEDRKIAATHAFNYVFNWIEERHKEEDTNQYELLPLHVIHRMIKDVDLTNQQILEVCDEVHAAFDKFDIAEVLKHTYSTIDAEAEFVAEFSEKKIIDYKNK